MHNGMAPSTTTTTTKNYCNSPTAWVELHTENFLFLSSFEVYVAMNTHIVVLWADTSAMQRKAVCSMYQTTI